jgi:SH3-like domain-containing protein
MNLTTQLTKRRGMILVAGMVLLFFSSSAFAAEYVSVKRDGVNVRTGPGTDKPVSMELFAGYPLKVIKKQGDWYKISDFENDTGWIYKSLVTKGDTVIINAKKSVNMRSGPSTKSSIVADVERGVVLTKISQKGKWTQVRHSSGTVGWVYNPLVWP